MRLLRAKVYRAFPELDRFDDAQCRRFVIAANASVLRWVVRVMGVGFGCLLVVCASIAGIYALSESLDQRTRFSEGWATVVWCLVCLGCVVAPCLSGLVFRDWLLRASIRRLIRRCGKCPKCRYSLLGIAVQANNVVVCPECGTEVVVDPALGELTTDAAGRTVYKAEVPILDHAAKERRRRRVRGVLKWSGIGVGSIVLIAAVAALGWWGWLQMQARAARVERGALPKLMAARAIMASGATVNGASEWEHFLRLVELARSESNRLVSDPAYQVDGKPVYFEASVLAPGFDDVQFDKDNGIGSASGVRRLTLDCVSHARESGAITSFRNMLLLKDPQRPIVLGPGGAASAMQFDGLGPSRAFVRFSAARMLVAIVSLEKTEYLDALDETLTAGSILERQGSLIERLVANAMRAAMFGRVMSDVERYPDERWAVDVLAVVQRHSRRAPMEGTLEFERAMSLDGLQEFFAEPKRVLKAQLNITQEDKFSPGSIFGQQSVPGGIGSYAANRDGLNALFDRLIAQQRAGPKDSVPNAVATSGLALVDLYAPALGKAIEVENSDTHEYRRCVVTLAARVYFKRTGRVPSGMADLATLVSDASVGIDPLTSKPWGFAAKAGPDGGAIVLDGDGKEAKEPWQRRREGRK